MLDKLLNPFIELLLLFIFLSKIPNKRYTGKAFFLNALVLAAYIHLRISLLENYDAGIMIGRIVFFSVFCCTLCDITIPNAIFVSASLSLVLHAAILFYYNLPFLSQFARQWELSDSIFITMIRLPIVLSMKKNVPDIARSDIELLEYLLVVMSCFGYLIDIRYILRITMSYTSKVETTVFCLSTARRPCSLFTRLSGMWYPANIRRKYAG